MSIIDIKVPDIGDFAEVTVIELLVKPGDTIKADQSLITVESDKASMEIPSSHGGVVKELKVKLGDKVSEGTLLLVVEAAGDAAAPISEQKQPVALVVPAQAATQSVAPPAAPPSPMPPALAARLIWTATYWSWAVVPAATAPPSAPPTLASRSWWWSAMPPWAVSA